MRFTKMQGIGNDYVYVDCFRESLSGVDLPELARRVSDRRFGIGGDGLILIMPGERGADFRMRMFNADGSEGDMCGNGMRCLARYVFDHGHTDRREFSVITPAGLIENRVLLKPDGTVAAVRVMVGKPGMLRGQVPMTGDPAASSRDVRLTAGDREFRGIALSLGNPHFVIEVDDAVSFPVATYGPLLEHHDAFPRRANIEFVTVAARDHIIMRVWERGSGITWACGTGASASAVAMAAAGRTDRAATVSLLGGDLYIEWAEDGRVYMTGPAEEVFTGDYPLV